MRDDYTRLIAMVGIIPASFHDLMEIDSSDSSSSERGDVTSALAHRVCNAVVDPAGGSTPPPPAGGDQRPPMHEEERQRAHAEQAQQQRDELESKRNTNDAARLEELRR